MPKGGTRVHAADLEARTRGGHALTCNARCIRDRRVFTNTYFLLDTRSIQGDSGKTVQSPSARMIRQLLLSRQQRGDRIQGDSSRGRRCFAEYSDFSGWEFVVLRYSAKIYHPLCILYPLCTQRESLPAENNKSCHQSNDPSQ